MTKNSFWRAASTGWGSRAPAALRARDDALVHDPASVVRRYFAIVADLDSSADDLLAVLHPTVRITERLAADQEAATA